MGKIFITKKIFDLNNVSLLLPFDNNFQDFSNNNFAVTANGNAQISSAQSKFGGASAYFDGSGDYLQTPNLFNFASQDWTIEFWLYANTQTDKHIIANVGSGQDGINIYIDGSSNITYNDGNTTTSVGTSYTSYWNQWTHIAVVRSGSTISMYVNGALAGTPTTQTPGTNQFLYIGKSGYSGYDFTGYIDDLRITKGVARYTANFTPPGPLLNIGKLNISKTVFPIANLLAFWRLEDLTDSSGNGYTLTNNGSVQFVAGKIGNAALGNGENYLTAPVALNLSNQPYTFSFWINLESFSDNFAIVLLGKYPGFSLNLQGDGNDNRIRLDDFTQASSYSSVSTLPFNTWTHLCITKDASQNVQIYFNGQLDAGTGTTNTSNIANFTLFSAFTFHNYIGRLDALGVWSRVLTINEVKTLYNNGAGLEPFRNGKLNITKPVFPMANLLAFWGFNENSATPSVGNPSYFLTNAGSITYSTGKVGGSINLPAGSRIRVDENLWDMVASPTSYSVAFWVKKNSLSGSGQESVIAGSIFGPMNFWFSFGLVINGDTPGGYENGIAYGQVTGATQYTWINAPFTVNLGEWIHVVGTYDLGTSTRKLYVNGNLTETQNGITPPTSVQHYSWNGFAINGSTIETNSSEYGGDHSYDGFGLWSRALTNAEIAALYNYAEGLEP